MFLLQLGCRCACELNSQLEDDVTTFDIKSMIITDLAFVTYWLCTRFWRAQKKMGNCQHRDWSFLHKTRVHRLRECDSSIGSGHSTNPRSSMEWNALEFMRTTMLSAFTPKGRPSVIGTSKGNSYMWVRSFVLATFVSTIALLRRPTPQTRRTQRCYFNAL